jgi:hypothetical protein
MASTYQQLHGYYRATNPLTLDTTSQAQKFFDEDEATILDDGILERGTIDSGLDMSPPMGDRRDSFAVGGPIFSPKTEDWQSVDMQSVSSNNPFLEPQNNNPFTRQDAHVTYGSQTQSWSMGHTSGTCTPVQYDGIEATYDGGASLFQRTIPMQTPFSNPTGHVPLFSAVGPTTSMPTSPQKDWMTADFKGQSLKRPHVDSSSIRSHNEMRRGDGIRKKNARFDIPAERNLDNIDTLISQSTDDQEIKELKQQKRLLRNRQAALDSRQRKKQHTERLEEEKKQYTGVISSMEEEIADLNGKLAQLLREKEFLQNHIEDLSIEKEEMVQRHTIETGDLRKKVSILTDHVQRLETSAMPNNNGFNNGFNDMENITMEGTWDNMGGYMEDYAMEPEVKQELQVVQKKNEITLGSEVEKPATQNGLLFMLFLVGAFVLSNRSSPTFPRVSEDMREASDAILSNILKDADMSHASNSVMESAAPQPSGASWATTGTVQMGGHAMDSVAPSMLGDLADSLTQPTEQQANEQVFSLTPAQYNGVTSQEFIRAQPPPTSTKRRNLAEALANMRPSDKQSASEVYTRSLLWEQIPGDVVRNFAKMVAECNGASNGQPACNEAGS